jgi:hypothetical protein
VLGGGICECLWSDDNDVTLFIVKQAYQNFNTSSISSILSDEEKLEYMNTLSK